MTTGRKPDTTFNGCDHNSTPLGRTKSILTKGLLLKQNQLLQNTSFVSQWHGVMVLDHFDEFQNYSDTNGGRSQNYLDFCNKT